MLTGAELGKAIAEAIRRKGLPKTTVARHFGVKSPSIYDWIHHGRIGKQHLNKLVAYFSDVVGPEHWGIAAQWLPTQESAANAPLNEGGSQVESVRGSNLAHPSQSVGPDRSLLIEAVTFLRRVELRTNTVFPPEVFAEHVVDSYQTMEKARRKGRTAAEPSGAQE